MMIFKRKSISTLALLFFGFICCIFNTGAMTHEAESEMDISYNVEQRGDYVLVSFGPISKALQTDYSVSGSRGAKLPGLISNICKNCNATAVIFDNIEYIYSETAATLTVTGHGEGIYATARNFVIEGFKLTNADELNAVSHAQWVRDVEASWEKAAKMGHSQFHDPARGKIVDTEFNRLREKRKKTPSEVGLKIKPLETVIIRGNIVKIGSDFCNPHIGYNRTEILPCFRIKTVDMSQSDVREIYNEAFFDCRDLENVIFPRDKTAPVICMGAFAGCPVEKSMHFSLLIDGSNTECKPLNYSNNLCCILL